MNTRPIPATETGLNLRHFERSSQPFQQQGAVLAVSLILLFAMTILGITALNSTKLEQNMAGNFQSSVRAFELAESAILDGMRTARDITAGNAGSSSANLGNYGGSYDMSIRQIDKTEVPRGRSSSGLGSAFTYWDITGTGTIKSPDGTTIVAEEIVHQGAFMLGPGKQ